MVYSHGANGIVGRYKGTNMGNIVRQTDGNITPHFWIMALWIDPADHKFYALAHEEYNYTGTFGIGPHFRRVNLWTSTDYGFKWTEQGNVLTSDNPDSFSQTSTSQFDFGVGDFTMYTDSNYFYIYYPHKWVFNYHDQEYPSVRVARSPKSSKMAVGSWQKFYNGSWGQPGVGGHDSDINMLGLNQTKVTYNTYLGKYIAISNREKDDWSQIDGDYISTATDLETQNWTTPIKLKDTTLWYL